MPPREDEIEVLVDATLALTPEEQLRQNDRMIRPRGAADDARCGHRSPAHAHQHRVALGLPCRVDAKGKLAFAVLESTPRRSRQISQQCIAQSLAHSRPPQMPRFQAFGDRSHQTRVW
jgi:hypothetical protein